MSEKCDPSVLNGTIFQEDFRVREYYGVHAISIVLQTSQSTIINHYMQALFKTKNLQETGICILTKLLRIQLLTIMCNNLYFQGQDMEDHVLTAGLYPCKHFEKLLSNHSNKSRTETDGVHTPRHKRSKKWTPSISSFTDRALQLSDVYLPRVCVARVLSERATNSSS